MYRGVKLPGGRRAGREHLPRGTGVENHYCVHGGKGLQPRRGSSATQRPQHREIQPAAPRSPSPECSAKQHVGLWYKWFWEIRVIWEIKPYTTTSPPVAKSPLKCSATPNKEQTSSLALVAALQAVPVPVPVPARLGCPQEVVLALAPQPSPPTPSLALLRYLLFFVLFCSF